MADSLFGWGSPVEIERRNRIRLCLYAYAYECTSHELVTDAEFDALAYSINPATSTGFMDEWWRTEFKPYTGAWIHNHPDLDGMKRLFQRVFK